LSTQPIKFGIATVAAGVAVVQGWLPAKRSLRSRIGTIAKPLENGGMISSDSTAMICIQPSYNTCYFYSGKKELFCFDLDFFSSFFSG
jgi:hypothetical protein